MPTGKGRQFYFPDDRKTRSLFHAIDDERKVTGKSMSKIVLQALEEHVEGNRRYIQQRLSDYAAEPKPWTEEEAKRYKKAMEEGLAHFRR